MSDARQALEECREELRQKAPQVLERVEAMTRQTIAQYRALGEGGELALLFLSISVAASVEEEEERDGK